ncbi:transporter substrate-binding domain-containing protein [Chromobacterium sp. S0633]|uniref:substrate-binding periplasmic protein n=1 Tax=Chromobacterium sp. S0633 TaxID=2957805 RepID=UPI00209FCAD1|nr:transporter substrate-binding domain-containing protein [Chromobacterium sp. S0633]
MKTGLARACLLLAACWAGGAHGGVSCPQRPIRFAFYEIGQFYSAGRGLDRDVAEELRRRSGCEFEFVVMPRARIWQELEAGSLDMTGSAIETPERSKIYWFFNYIQLRQYAILSIDVPDSIRSMESFIQDAPSRRWAIVRSYSTSRYFDPLVLQLGVQRRLVEVAEEDVLFRMLDQRRVAGIFSTPMVYRQKIRQHGLEDRVKVADWEKDDAPSPRSLVLTKRAFPDSEARAWRQLVDGRNRDGTMLRLINRYMSKDEAAAAVWAGGKR